MGVLRLGFIANFLSHPVISGFITASGILIAASQLKYVLGIKADGETLPGLLGSLAANLGAINLPTLAIGVAATASSSGSAGAEAAARPPGPRPALADMLTKAGPVAAVAVSTAGGLVARPRRGGRRHRRRHAAAAFRRSPCRSSTPASGSRSSAQRS